MREVFEYLPEDLFFSQSLVGKQCQACRGAFPYGYFRKDSSIRDGRALVCLKCENTPRESTEEALARVRETNLNSAAIEAQRRPNEIDYLERDCVGRSLYYNDFIALLRKVLGPRLIVAPAYFLNEVSIYVEDSKLEDFNGVRYLGFLETVGKMNEFSEYIYNDYGVPTGESRRGYRGILMKLILEGYATEQQISKTFGPCDEKVWCRTLYNWRNQKN